jgi:hypothetical protein
MKPDMIRNKDNTSTMSLPVECLRHTKHLRHRASPYRNCWKPGGLVCEIMTSIAKNVRREPVNGMSRETPDYKLHTGLTPWTAEPVCLSNG